MGSLIGNLTNTAVSDPSSGQTKWYGGGDNAKLAQALTPQPGQVQPSMASSAASPGPNGPTGPNSPTFSQPAPNLPQEVKPTFQQAAGMGATPGGGNAMSPGLTKAGKLAVLLTSGLQGALAGRAASEQSVIQSGGHRSSGAGTGFEAGYTLPWQRESQQAQVAQQQAQTSVLQSEGGTVNVPGIGPMPGWLAKQLGPAYLRAGSAETVQGMKGTTAQDVAGISAGARTGAAQIGADARIKAAQLGLGPIAQVPQDLQDQFGLPAELPLRMLNQAETAANKPLTVVQGENGPSVINKQDVMNGKPGSTKSTGLGSPRLGGPIQVADPNSPGNTRIETAGQAVNQGAAGSQSASVQVPKAAEKSAVPSNIGDLKVGFTTMIQHADLLRRAAKALNNGDTQTLNGLENSFKNEFGYSGPITATAISDAYQGEVTNVISKGHITDQESKKVGNTLDPSKQNYATIDSVLSAYQALAQSKMDMLNKQTDSAVNASQPKRPGSSAPPPNSDPFAAFGGKAH